MAKAKKKVAAVNKVTLKNSLKVSAAKEVLKEVSYGAGVLAHKVSKVGKVVHSGIWKDARSVVQKKINAIKGSFARQMKFIPAKKSITIPEKLSQEPKAAPVARARSRKKSPTRKGG
ncbi:MAG: hypothetical protein HQL16_05835 [Candidatus Omnitrophica bacterium]|nr:hypothetical protein [Candidatus Omnitrophota bacterium]